MAKKTKTAGQARSALLYKGISISQWAREHKVSRSLVHAVLQGDRPCRFGQSHRVAVMLGLKDGELTD